MNYALLIGLYGGFSLLWIVFLVLSTGAPGLAAALSAKEGATEHLTHALLLVAVVWHLGSWLRDRLKRHHVFLSVLCLVFLLEETDYLQLYLGFPTPSVFRDLTGRSDLFNFHNTLIADLFIPAFFSVYFLILPVVARQSSRARAFLARLGLLPPRLEYAALFWLNGVFAIASEAALAGRINPAELFELFIALLLLLFAPLSLRVFGPVAG